MCKGVLFEQYSINLNNDHHFIREALAGRFLQNWGYLGEEGKYVVCNCFII